jgi:5-methylcytosine-specific restriction endonuclease McrA
VSDYTSKRYRKLRQQFRDDCRRNRLPCSICKQSIDYGLESPHQWAWELHHIKPSSQYPHLHYLRANHSASHSRCNKRQGDKPMTSPEEWVRP